MKIRTGGKYIFKASGPDIWDKKDNTPSNGTTVKVIKAPYGCPKNGTMNHCYVSDVDDNFIGLVCISSLRKQ